MTPKEIIAQVRARLNEPTAAQWADKDLRGWINEGLRDAARHTRHLRGNVSINVIADAVTVTMPANVIEIENAYWVTADNRSAPLIECSFDRANDVWGEWQNISAGVPYMFAPWGTPPTLTVKLYPKPETGGSLSLLVVRMPNEIALSGEDDDTAIDWPPAWSDLIADYVEMMALRRDRDQRWTEAFQFYTSKRDSLDINGHYSHEADFFVHSPRAGVLPRWLVED